MANTRRPTIVGSDYSPFSKSPGHLNQVTMDPNFSMASYQSAVIMGSPVQSRTMKDYEEQMSSLRKENFNLKLNVYFLEERLYATNSTASQDNLLKKNIELKIDLENLRRDLNEKQELLCDAARALELMEASAARKEAELLTQISSMEDEMHALRSTAVAFNNDRLKAIEMNASNITMGVDDSCILYAAAFNLKPTPDEVKVLQNKPSKNEPCECHQLRALLTVERENVITLKDNIATRDQQIAELKQQIQEAEDKLKMPLIKSESDISCDRIKDEPQVNDDSHQLERLQQENLNACQMIQGCMLRIKQMDRENHKMKNKLKQKEKLISKLEVEEVTEDRYKEIVKMRDAKIEELENDLKNFKCALKDSNDTKSSSHCDDKEWSWMNSHLKVKIDTLRESIYKKPECKIETDSEDFSLKSIDIQDLLVKRLQEMAYVFDSLLSNKCIIGEEKRRKVENLLEQTIDLQDGLKIELNASHNLEETFMDNSFGKPPQDMKLDNLTMMFGHHMSIGDTSQLISYKHLEESNHKSIECVIENQNKEIDMLKNQIKTIKSRCICDSAFEEDSGDKGKTSCYEYNKLVTRKSKNKLGKIKYLNSTWNGCDAPQINNSESECWSEPDRTVSLERMGHLSNITKELNSSDDEICDHCHRQKYHKNATEPKELETVKYQLTNLTQIKINLENLLNSANTKIGDLEFQLTTNKDEMLDRDAKIDQLTEELRHAENSLNLYISKYENLETRLNEETDRLKLELESVQKHAVEIEESLLREQKITEDKLKEAKTEMKEFQSKVEKEWVSRVRYEAMRKELDNGALQASQATLDKALATEQKIRSDAEADRLKNKLGEAQLKINKLESINSDLQNRYESTERVMVDSRWSNRLTPSSRLSSGHSSPQASSSDNSLENERLPIVDLIDITSQNFSPAELAAENMILKEKLKRTQMQVLQMKHQPYKERLMCNEIHKSLSLLRKVRDNINHNS